MFDIDEQLMMEKEEQMRMEMEAGAIIESVNISSDPSYDYFDRYTDVGTLRIFALPEVSDEYLIKVGAIYKLIFDEDNPNIDRNLKNKFFQTMKDDSVYQRVGYKDGDFYDLGSENSKIDHPGNNYEDNQTDFIWEPEGSDDPTGEIIEHSLHTITNVAFRLMSSDWDYENSSSKIRLAYQEAVNNGVFNEDFYKRIVDEVVVVSGTREAEMVKLLENTYRHVNIALINELAILCDMLNLDIWEVVNAAGTKPFGFESFHPGPGVGGHCIPIDPQYLSFKTRQIGQPVRFVELAQEINNSMPAYVCDRVSLFLNDLGMPVKNSRILIYGVAYKPDIGDVRESPALEIFEILSGKGAEEDYFDPFVEEFKLESRDLVSIDSRHELKDYDMLLNLTLNSETNIEKINNSETPVFDTCLLYTSDAADE